jgi:non-ribosomal peptide synthetase-like protein
MQDGSAQRLHEVLTGGVPMQLGTTQPRLLHEFFERQVANNPDAIAVEHVELNVRLTYRELNERATMLAHLLQRNGVCPGDVIGIHLPRSVEQYVSMLGILKAGGAYLAIDTTFPEDRVHFTLEDSGAGHLITVSDLLQSDWEELCVPLLLDTLNWDEADEINRQQWATPLISDEDLCYIIYTSGTTGRPKGVCISHRNAVTFVRAMGEVYGLRGDDRVLQGFSTSFDASVEEIWAAFSMGSTLVVGTLETMRSVDELAERLRRMEITVFSTIPTLMGVMDKEDIPELRILILGGEAARTDIVERWWTPERRILNTYGPTECAVVATMAECRPGEAITIGQPLPYYETIVINDQLEEVSRNTEGELAIAGDGVSLRGYLHREELNTEKFVMIEGKRYYRTGDLVYLNDNDNIVFCGRIDAQVKIRGYRVELGEIEARLAKLPDCDSAIVALKTDNNDIKQLVAYIIQEEVQDFDVHRAQEELRHVMPSYMVPSQYCSLSPNAVPRLNSGKVDRRKLPGPDELHAFHTVGHNEGEIDFDDVNEFPTEMHRALGQIWSSVLKQPIGSSDSFFEYGGSSVMAAQVISECRKNPMLSVINVRDLYSNETINALVPVLQKKLEAKEEKARKAEEKRQAEASAPPKKNKGITAETHPHYRVPTWEYLTVATLQIAVILSSMIFGSLTLVGSVYVGYYGFKWLYFNTTNWLTISVGVFMFALPMIAIVTGLLWGLFVKRVLIGPFREEEFPIWSFAYFRWWSKNLFLAPVRGLTGMFVGTPFATFLYRLFGAKIGKNVYLATGLVEFDLIEIGDNCTISDSVSFRTHFVEDGFMKFRKVVLEDDVFVGPETTIRGGNVLSKGTRVHSLTSFPEGITTPPNSHWQGSPAVQVTDPNNAMVRLLEEMEAEARPEDGWDNWSNKLKVISLQFLFGYVFGLAFYWMFLVEIAVVLSVPFLLQAVLELNLWVLLPLTLVASTFRFFGQLATIIVMKRLLGGRAKPGTYAISSLEFVRRWSSHGMMNLLVSPHGNRGVVETLLMPQVCRWLGMKVGKGCEISDAKGCDPELVTLQDGVMIADEVVLNTVIVHRGLMRLGELEIGAKTFVGNSAQVPITTPKVESGCLIGVLGLAPDEMEPNSSWLGSPPMKLPVRNKDEAPDELTFSPPRHMVWARAFFNFWKMILPGALMEMVAWGFFTLAVAAFLSMPLTQFLLVFPLITVAASLVVLLLPVLFKWTMIGRYKKGTQYLWSFWMWRFEIAYEVEGLVMDVMEPLLIGNPLANWWYRAMGAKIGKRVCLLRGFLMEADLITIGDDACVEGVLQTHLFEDRVMKLGNIVIGEGANVGQTSCVLYDSEMGERSSLGDLSLVMKNEMFESNNRYYGLPAENMG